MYFPWSSHRSYTLSLLYPSPLLSVFTTHKIKDDAHPRLSYLLLFHINKTRSSHMSFLHSHTVLSKHAPHFSARFFFAAMLYTKPLANC